MITQEQIKLAPDEFFQAVATLIADMKVTALAPSQILLGL